MVLAPFFGRLAARIGQRALLVPGGLVYAGAGVLSLFVVGTEPSYATELLPAGLIGGLGVALVIPQLASAAVQGLPSDEFGAGAAVNQAIRQFGATFGVALVVALLGTVTPLNAIDHFQRIWWLLVASGVLTSVAALALPRPSRGAAPVLAPEPVGAEA